MEKSDHHIALTLSGAVVGVDEVYAAEAVTATRKSLRRTWNQLPRCQRNLIIIGIFALCVTLLLLLPNEQIIFENGKVLSLHAGRKGHISNERSDSQRSKNFLVLPNKRLKDIESISAIENVVPVPEDNHQFKKVNLPQPPVLIPDIDNEQKLTDIDKVNFIPYSSNHNTKNIHAQKINLNSKSVESPFADDNLAYEAVLKLSMKQPEKVPENNDLTIDEFVAQLATSSDGQKQHFHGATNERQSAVVAAFKHSWNGYKKYAWGHDNLKPVTQSSHDWFGLGLTIVDSLDTMYIMGLEDEFNEARDWVKDFLNFDISRDVNLFEVTIRVLGGLLASYHLSGDKMFLKKSLEIGNRLLPCFVSPSGIPYSDVNLGSMSAHSPKWSPDSSTSEVTTIQLEFRDLSRSTKIKLYEKVAHVVNEKVHALEKKNGLVPIFINANTGTFRNYATISLGARGDSYYEYLLKQWLQTGRKKDDFFILDYMSAIDGVLTQLMRRTTKEQHVYIGELINGKDFKPKMDHLTCYLPGTLLLGHKFGMPDSHLSLAKDLLETCYQTYMRQPTKLAPEISYFAVSDTEEQEMYVKPNDAHNLLRPEFIESLYYFYVITGNRTYQDMGWTIFQAFEKHTKVASGYTSIGNVKNIFNTRLRDMMESFWLSETLKYFYLLFSDNRDEIDLEKWVFNSEAHPLPIRTN